MATLKNQTSLIMQDTMSMSKTSVFSPMEKANRATVTKLQSKNK
jgi:hypothetical protein